jgi:hypothetical protein
MEQLVATHADELAEDTALGQLVDYVQRLNNRYTENSTPVFVTDAVGLYEAYLAGFADDQLRKEHTCSCCKNYITRFGGLVRVNEDGSLTSAVWEKDTVPEMYRQSVENMLKIIERSKIKKVFISSLYEYGHTLRGGWRHFGIRPPLSRIHTAHSRKDTPNFVAGLKEVEAEVVTEALKEFPMEAVKTAYTLLNTSSLSNSRAVLGPITFLLSLHTRLEEVKNQLYRSNIIRDAVANAPSGFCHIRGGMSGTLLEDIVAGTPHEVLRRKFNLKMDPLKYQRAQVAPTAGAIAEAEKVFADIGAASALKRRYATMADIGEKVWEAPKPKEQASGDAIFSSITPKTAVNKNAVAPQQIGSVNISWAKFKRTVLPTAEKLEYFAINQISPYTGLTAAVDPESVPIFQWDNPARRNQVAQYTYVEGKDFRGQSIAGSYPSKFGLQASTWVEVLAVTPLPHLWYQGKFDHLTEGAILLLKGAVDTGNAANTSAIFSSSLRSEFHAYRSVIEAYSNANPLAPHTPDDVCGVAIGAGDNRCSVRVTTGNVIATYLIDRWE